MSENTKIEWCDHTFNPWIGCTKVGPGCDNCYAEADFDKRRHVVRWGPGEPRKRTSEANWAKPLTWNRYHDKFFFKQHGRRQRVFCASLADVFDNHVPTAWRVDLLDLIRATPNLDWLLLTKRIGNVRGMLAEALSIAQSYGTRGTLANWIGCWVDGEPPANVWLGATIVNQEEADRDIPKLLTVPARARFLSMEPLLGPVDITEYMWPVCGWWRGPHNSYHEAKAAGAECGLKRQALVSANARFVTWVIVGGESGPGARPMHPDWARSLRDQCLDAGVPFLFKQWGEWGTAAPMDPHGRLDFRGGGVVMTDDGNVYQPGDLDWPDGPRRGEAHRANFPHHHPTYLYRVGKKRTGRELDGRTWDQYPEAVTHA